jgi:hypothetical protein
MRDGLDTIGAAWQTLALAYQPASATAGAGTEPALPGGASRLSFIARGLGSPTGRLSCIAASMHAAATDSPVPTTSQIPVATLPLVVQAIRVAIDSGGMHDPHIVDHAATIGQLAALGTTLCGWDEQGQWVTCPVDTEQGVCGRRLRIDLAAPDRAVQCWWCQTMWTPAQLLYRAVHGGGELWADPEAIAGVTQIPLTRIRRWKSAGKIRSRGQLVLASDVIAARDSAIHDAHRQLAGQMRTPATVNVRYRCDRCGELHEVTGSTLTDAHTAIEQAQAEHTARHARRWHTDGSSEPA